MAIVAIHYPRKTVFVLGAGASRYLGYPLGEELARNIITGFLPAPEFEWPRHHIEIFKTALRNSGLPSVDAFLEKAEAFNDGIKYLDIGRFAIAQQLMKREKIESLYDSEENWYRYLWGRLHNNLEKLIDGSIAFVTFNYDLSLEDFLYTSLQYSKYGHSLSEQQQKELGEFMSKISIVHVYGKLGDLFWQEPQRGRKYGSYSAQEAWRASQKIKIVRENEIITEEFKKAQTLLEQANQVCFLGFGYDVTNLKRLGVYEKVIEKPTLKVFGTAINLGMAERSMVENSFNAAVRNKVKLAGDEQRIIKVLKDHLEDL